MDAVQHKILNATPFAVGATLVVASTFGDDDGPVFCLFRRCTGGYCPGCGGSRAFTSMIKGDFATSWTLHPWVLVIAAQVVVLGGLLGTQQRRALGPNGLDRLLVPVLVANLVFGVGLWVVRLSAGSIPIPFG